MRNVVQLAEGLTQAEAPCFTAHGLYGRHSWWFVVPGDDAKEGW